jgi:outer membrane protein assembly factor BamB
MKTTCWKSLGNGFPLLCGGLVLSLLTAMNPSDARADSDWPMWRYDAARSADTPQQLAEHLHLQWVRQLPKPKRAWPHQWDHRGKLDFDVSYSPVVAGQRIFVPSNVTDSVTAYRIDDGAELWRFYTDGPVRLAPAVWNGSVYFVSDDGHLYCVSAETGALAWKFRGGPSDHRLLGNERIINLWAARGGPVVKDGTIYFAAGIWPLHGVFIYALDAESGDVKWVNDTTSSDYVELPHGGADAYGGLAPQGYLAADADQLVVSAGRGPNPVHLDRQTGQVIRSDYRGSKGRGSYAVHAVDGGGMGMRRNPMLEDRVKSLSQQIDGKVFDSLAARDRLFVTTEEGRLFCFGPHEVEPVRYDDQSTSLEPRTGDWAQTAHELLKALGESEGYALMLGAGSGDLLRELLTRSDLHIVVAEADALRARALRDELAEAGMYGRRAAVIQADPAAFSVQPYLFSMVVCENAKAAGMGGDAAALAAALDRLRPYGGVAWLGGVTVSQSELTDALAAAEVGQVSMEARRGHLFARRGGPLSGAGQWTHQYHDPANTLLSRDQRVRLPLGLLWFGGPNNHNILPRHAGGPRPQVAGGRQVYLGVETMGARCVYTGRQLWQREFPRIGHPFTDLALEKSWRGGSEVYMSNIPGATYIGSPFVTLADSVYLRYEGRIHRLDPASGETTGEFSLPGRSVAELYGEDAPDWGHISVQGDFLVTTTEPHIFEDQTLGDNNSYSGTSSRRLVVMDRRDGRVHWQREARIGFRHGAIVSTKDTLFLIDGLSENAVKHQARRGRVPQEPSVVLALDLQTGKERWRTDSNVFGTFLLVSEDRDILVEGGSQDLRRRFDDEPRKITARRGRDGTILWEGGSFVLPAAVRGDMLIPGRPGNAISLLTGKTWPREQPHTGARDNWSYSRRYGCNTLNASENLLLYRSGYASYFDLEHDSGTGNFGGFRSGCTANMIAADGVLNALDYTRSCTCSYAQQTSLALVPMPGDANIEFWTRHDAARPNPAGHGLNFGAPGRRVDAAGRIWHQASGTHRRHASAITDDGGSIAWVAASAKEADKNETITIDDVVEGDYTVRLHFAELTAGVQPGQRVFDVLIDGQKVLNAFDIVAQAQGCFRGTVQEFTVRAGKRITVELRKSDGAELGPLINGLEIVAEAAADIEARAPRVPDGNVPVGAK